MKHKNYRLWVVEQIWNNTNVEFPDMVRVGMTHYILTLPSRHFAGGCALEDKVNLTNLRMQATFMWGWYAEYWNKLNKDLESRRVRYADQKYKYPKEQIKDLLLYIDRGVSELYLVDYLKEGFTRNDN
jgi:hypothetical protein